MRPSRLEKFPCGVFASHREQRWVLRESFIADLYLNHAGTSWPKPAAVTLAVHKATVGSALEWPDAFAEAHRALCAYFGVAQPERLLWTPGCTSSLSVAVSDVLLLDTRRRVLTSRWEHHAMHRPLLKLAASGARLDYIPTLHSAPNPGQIGGIDLNWLEETLEAGDVGLVAITAASNVTGELLPWHEVIQLAHQYGAMVLLDAAQIAGWMELDLDSLEADLVAFGGHKGLQGPWGIGGLYVSDRANMQCTSANCAIPDPNAGDPRPLPGYCDVGSVDQVALAGLRAAIQFLNQLDMSHTLRLARQQIGRIKTCLREHARVRLHEPTQNSLPTIAFAVAGIASQDVARELAKSGIVVGSGLQCAPLAHETLGTSAEGLVRISVGVGQADAEVDELIARLHACLPELPES